MKIAFTVTDASDHIHVGGEVERKTATVLIDDADLPRIVKDYLAGKAKEKESHGRRAFYQSMSVSIVDEH